MQVKHFLSVEQITDLPNRYNRPVAVMRDNEGFVFLTDMLASTQHGETKPVRVFMRPVTWKTGE